MWAGTARCAKPSRISQTTTPLVVLKHAEQDALSLGPLMRQLLLQTMELAGDQMRRDVIVGRMTILIASPHRTTTYHIDSETNFLLQVTGDKIFHAFDQTDRSLITDEELERFHGGDLNGAIFKAERQGDAQTYDLRAGFGVHLPSYAPHWAQNRDSVSVALSLNYDLRSVQRVARIYSFNHRLRRLGVKPIPPGASPWRDRAKLTTSMIINTLRHRSRPSGPANAPSGWTPPAI